MIVFNWGSATCFERGKLSKVVEPLETYPRAVSYLNQTGNVGSWTFILRNPSIALCLLLLLPALFPVSFTKVTSFSNATGCYREYCLRVPVWHCFPRNSRRSRCVSTRVLSSAKHVLRSHVSLRFRANDAFSEFRSTCNFRAVHTNLKLALEQFFSNSNLFTPMHPPC